MLATGATLGIVGLAAGSWEQSHIWHDSETLWRWAMDVDPRCAVCRLNLAQAVIKDAVTGEARLAEVDSLLRETIRLRPEYAEPYYNLGTALLVRKRYDEAEAALKTFMALAPARDVGPERLGLLYLVQGRYAEALPLLRQAARVRGSALPPAAGRTAIRSLADALGLLSDTPETLVFVGRALVEQGRSARRGRAAAPRRGARSHGARWRRTGSLRPTARRETASASRRRSRRCARSIRYWPRGFPRADARAHVDGGSKMAIMSAPETPPALSMRREPMRHARLRHPLTSSPRSRWCCP